MIFYLARVQDTEGNWWLKTGTTKDTSKRFSDKRLYKDWEYIHTQQYDKADIKNVEKKFKDLQVGKEWAQTGIPSHFMGKTEVMKEEVTEEMVLERMQTLNTPTKTTLEDFGG